MGQITKETIKMIRNYVARGEPPPLTIHEADQLATAWERWNASAQPSGNPGELPAVNQQLTTADERAAFERWASDGGAYPNAVERSGNVYRLATTELYWKAWQARAALAQKDAS